MAWNAAPEIKHLWPVEDQEHLVPYGAPIYEHGRAVAQPRFIPHPEVAGRIKAEVASRGGRELFSRPDWRDQLLRLAGELADKGAVGRMETQEEYEARVRDELARNKNILEEGLGKPVDVVCWPGGAYNDTCLRLAEESGHRASTVKEGHNRYGDDPSQIHRISGFNPYGNGRFPWKYKKLTFAFYLRRFEGNPFCVLLDAAHGLLGRKWT
jgi:hypothetical protein